jgi:hypothetical protein
MVDPVLGRTGDYSPSLILYENKEFKETAAGPTWSKEWMTGSAAMFGCHLRTKNIKNTGNNR